MRIKKGVSKMEERFCINCKNLSAGVDAHYRCLLREKEPITGQLKVTIYDPNYLNKGLCCSNYEEKEPKSIKE